MIFTCQIMTNSAERADKPTLKIQKTGYFRRNNRFKLELLVGIEPTTCSLRGRSLLFYVVLFVFIFAEISGISAFIFDNNSCCFAARDQNNDQIMTKLLRRSAPCYPETKASMRFPQTSSGLSAIRRHCSLFGNLFFIFFHVCFYPLYMRVKKYRMIDLHFLARYSSMFDLFFQNFQF